jgi:hypothetical protein
MKGNETENRQQSKGRSIILLAVLLVAALAAIFLVGRELEITGFQTIAPGEAHTQEVLLTITSDQEYEWELSEHPQTFDLRSVMLDGSVIGERQVKAVLVAPDGKEYDILDEKISAKAKSGGNDITGLSAIDEEPTTPPVEQQPQHPTEDQQPTEPPAEQPTEPPAESPAEPQPPVSGSERSITTRLEYQTGTRWDSNDDGTTYTRADAVDFTVAGTGFNWAADKDKACTRWTITSLDSGAATSICNGASECCALYNLAPKDSSWDSPLYIYYEQYGTTLRNTVSAQVVYVDQSLEEGNVHFNSTIGSEETLTADFVEAVETGFSSKCEQTCELPAGINATEYIIRFSVENGTVLKVDRILYVTQATGAENLTGNESNASISLEVVDSKGNLVPAQVTISNRETGRTILSKNTGESKKEKGIAGVGAPAVEEVPKGRHKITINIADAGMSVKGIEIADADTSLNNTQFVRVDDVPETAFPQFTEVYAIDPSSMNFTTATVTAAAKGTGLYKCREWDFATQTCYGTWEFLQPITPGEDYTFKLTPEDPAYGETTYTTYYLHNESDPQFTAYKQLNTSGAHGTTAANSVSLTGTGVVCWATNWTSPNFTSTVRVNGTWNFSIWGYCDSIKAEYIQAKLFKLNSSGRYDIVTDQYNTATFCNRAVTGISGWQYNASALPDLNTGERIGVQFCLNKTQSSNGKIGYLNWDGTTPSYVVIPIQTVYSLNTSPAANQTVELGNETTLTWNVSGAGGYYYIQRNGTLFEGPKSWQGPSAQIITWPNTYFLGDWNYTLFYNETGGSNASSTTTLTVVDNIQSNCSSYTGGSAGTGALTLKTITINGDVGEWDSVLRNPANYVSDLTLIQGDTDAIATNDRDMTKFVYTYDSQYLYFYYKRTIVGSRQVSMIVYLDKDLDGLMETGENVLKFVWSGTNRQYNGDLYNYHPAVSSGDVMQGSGYDMPGSISNNKELEYNVIGGTILGTELETRVLWSDLGYAGPTPLKMKGASGLGSATNLPSQLEDNVGDMVQADNSYFILIPDREKATKNGTTVYYDHEIMNCGNAPVKIDLKKNSSQGWNVTLYYPYSNQSQITDSNGNSLPDVSLAAGQYNIVVVKIDVPGSASLGTVDKTNITGNTSKQNATVIDTTTVSDIAITPAFYSAAGAQGMLVSFNYTIYNYQTYNDTIEVTTSTSNAWTTTARYANGTTLADTDGDGRADAGMFLSGQSKQIIATVQIPGAATIGTIDTLTVRINSSVTPTKTVAVTANTTVRDRLILVPAGYNRTVNSDTREYYQFNLTNNWNSSDTIDLSYTCTQCWNTTFVDSDMQPLTDTDSDGKIDTGAIPAYGGNMTIYIKILVPANATMGFSELTTIYANSSVNTSVYRTAIVNSTPRGVAFFNDTGRTTTTYSFVVNDTVYSRAFYLQGVSQVYMVWYDGLLARRTSPNITVTGQGYADDAMVTNVSFDTGTWTVIVYNAADNTEITRNTFNLIDPLIPSLIAWKPAQNQTAYTSTYIELAANVTDNVGAYLVQANVSYPNGTWKIVELYQFDNVTWNSTNFLIPNLTGRYNVTFTAYDTSQNVNNTQTTYFIVYDNIPPSVTALIPSSGSQYGYSTTIEIGANVTDNIAVSTVYANITYPNGTVQTITLTNVGGAKYNSSFTTPSLPGAYTVRFFANDTSGNFNATETTQFTVIPPAPTTPQLYLNAPYDGFSTSSSTVVFNWTANSSQYPTMLCNLTIDGAVNISNILVSNNTPYTTTVSNFNYTTHNWNVRCWGDITKVNTSGTRTFTTIATPPNIFLAGPPNGSYDSNGDVTFSYNVTHSSGVANCTAFLNSTAINTTYSVPLDTKIQFNKINISDGKWEWNVNCTDSLGATGQSQTWTLVVARPANAPNGTLIINETIFNADGQFVNGTIELVDLGSMETDAVTYSGVLKNITAGNYDIRIKPYGIVIQQIVLHNVSIVTNITDIIDLDNTTTTEFNFVSMYAIKPYLPGYEYLNLTVTAVTGDAFVCLTWNFTSRTCPNNAWKKMGNFDPGHNYTITIYGGSTVGFMESNLTINLIDAYGYLIPNNQTQIYEDGTIVNVLLRPTSGKLKNVTIFSHDKINKNNDLQIGDFANQTGWVNNFIIDPSSLNFINATIVSTAASTSTSLWKCTNYSYEDEICSNNFTLFMDLVPDQIYTFTINATDPVFFEQPNDSTGKDTYIDETGSGNNYGTSTEMRVDVRNNGRNQRGMIEWNISAIPTGMSITSAVMSLYLNASTGNAIDITAARLTSAWNETNVTWATKPGYDTTVYATVSVGTVGLFYDWNITTLVKQWYNGTYPNYGMYMKAPTENLTGNSQAKRFATSDYTAAAYRPRINITFNDITAPNVTLVTPGVGYYNDTASLVNVTFNCSVTDTYNLSNVSLYITNSQNTSFALNRTTSITGTSAWANWTLQLTNGNYTWNCLAYDTSGNLDWGDQNRTVAINYTATQPTLLAFSLTLPGKAPVNASEAGNDTALMQFNSSSNTLYNMDACVGGTNDCQNSTQPFFLYLNTGNLNLTIAIRLNETLPSVLNLKVNTQYNSSNATNVSTAPITLSTGMQPGATFNAWFWGDFLNAYPTDSTYRKLTSNGTQTT